MTVINVTDECGKGRGCGETEPKLSQKEPRDWLTRAAEMFPCLGILLALCTSFFLGSASLLVKMTSSVHGVQVAVFRAIIQVIIYLSLIIVRRLPMKPATGELKAVTARAIFSALSITCTHSAIKMIPLGDLTVIKFSLPIWALIIGYLVLKEPCSLLKVLAALVSMMGVGLIAKPDLCVYVFHLIGRGLDLESEETLQRHALEYWQGSGLDKSSSEAITSVQNETTLIANTSMAVLKIADSPMQLALGEVVVANADNTHLEGCLLALASSVLLAMSIVALKLCKRTPAETIIFWLSIYSVLFGVGLLLHLGQWRMPSNGRDWLYILLNGLCGAAGQWCFTSALKVEQSGIISLARTADIQVAFIYSAFLLHEQIRGTSIVGSLLVSSAVIAIFLPKLFANRRQDSRQHQQKQPHQQHGQHQHQSQQPGSPREKAAR